MADSSVVYVAQDESKKSTKWWVPVLGLFVLFLGLFCIITRCDFLKKQTSPRVVYVLGSQGDTPGQVNEEAVEVVARKTSEIISGKCSSRGFWYTSSKGFKCISNPLTLFYNSTNKTLRIGDEVVKLGGVSSLSSLEDVNLIDLKENQVLAYDGEKWVNKEVSNANLPECSDTQILKWGNNQWQCASLSIPTYTAGTGLALNGNTFTLNASIGLLTDVDTNSNPPSSGQVLKWNGSKWVPEEDNDAQQLSIFDHTISLTNGGSVTVPDNDTLASLSCSNGQVAKWDGSGWVCSNDDIGATLPNGTITDSTLRWDGSSWIENTNFTIDENGVVTSGTWHGSVIDISDYTNLAAGNGINLNGDTVEINAPTCSGTDKLQWNGSAFVCSADQDTTYSAGTGLQLTGTTFSLNAGIDLLTDVDTSTNAPTDGQVLKWDGSNWVPGEDNVGSSSLPSGTAGQTLRYDGSDWVANSLLFNNGSQIGIGTNSPEAKLHVVADVGDLTFSTAPRFQAQGATGGNSDMVNLTLYTSNAGINYSTGLSFAMQNNNNDMIEYSRIRSMIIEDTAGTEKGALDIFTMNNGTLAPAVRINYDGKVGIGTPWPVAPLDVELSSAANNSTSVVARYGVYSNGTATGGIGVAHEFYTQDVNDSPILTGKIEFVSHIVDAGPEGDASTNNASFFRLYTERETWNDFMPVISAYATSSDRMLCMNGIESNNLSQWDCLGMTIGGANSFNFWFDGTNRGSIDYTGDTLEFRTGKDTDKLEIKTIGNREIFLDSGNDGVDVAITPGSVGIGLSNPAGATLVVQGTMVAEDDFTDTVGYTYSHYNLEGQYTVPAGSSIDLDYVGIQLNPKVTINESCTGEVVGTRSMFNLNGQSPGEVETAIGFRTNSYLSNEIYAGEYFNISSEVYVSDSSSVDTLYGFYLGMADNNGNIGDLYGLYIEDFDMNFIGGKLGLGYEDYPDYTLQLPNDPTDGVAMAYQWATYSDARVKTNQKDLHYGLDTIMKLRPKEYIHHTAFFKDGSLVLKDGKKDIGLIAQEVDKVLPEAVKRPKSDHELWGLDYEKFIPVLIKAVQELAGKAEKVEKQQSAFVVKKSKGKFVVPNNVSVFSVKYSELTADDMVLLTPSGLTPVAFSVEVLDGEFKVHLKGEHPKVEFKYLIVK